MLTEEVEDDYFNGAKSSREDGKHAKIFKSLRLHVHENDGCEFMSMSILTSETRMFFSVYKVEVYTFLSDCLLDVMIDLELVSNLRNK